MKNRPIVIYVLVAYAWTWMTVLPLILQRRGMLDTQLPDAWEALGAFGPLIAAVLVLSRNVDAEARAEFWRSLRRWRVPLRWRAFVILSPLAFLALAVLLATTVSGEPADFGRLSTGRLATLHGLVDLLLISSVVQALGEEPGWRGFLLPRLRERFGPLAASLVLFPVWLFWHLPFFLSRPEFGLAQFAGFSLGILSATMWFTLLWDATRSIFVAIVWHALLNISRGIALSISTTVFLSYGTVVLAGAIVIVAGWFFRARRVTVAAP